MRSRLVLLALLAAGTLRGQQLQLSFDGHGEFVFTAGEVIRLPQDWSLNGIQLKPEGEPNEEFAIQLDGRFLAKGTPRTSIKAASPNNGFLRQEMHTLRLLKGLDRVAEWNLERATQAHIETQRSNGASLVPDVRIDEPVLFQFQPGHDRLEGSVTSEGAVQVKVAGRPVERDLARDGWGFAVPIPKDPELQAIELLVESAGGSFRRFLLPIVR